MKLSLIVPALLLLGCGSGAEHVSAQPPMDAGVEDAEAGDHNPASGLCCQLTVNESDSSLFAYDRYECSEDSGPDYSNIPWLCNWNSTPAPCTSSACVVGSSCQGDNGWGQVVPCDSPPYNPDAGYEGGIDTASCAGPQAGCGNLWCWPDCKNGSNETPEPPGTPHPGSHPQM